MAKRKTRRKKTPRLVTRIRDFRVRIRLFFRRVVLVCLTLLMFGGTGVGAWWWFSGRAELTFVQARNDFYAKTGELGLKLSDIYLEGRHQTPADQAKQAIDLPPGYPMLAINLADVRHRLENLPWVREAVVERSLPSTLYVRIIEREPMALWQHHGKLYLVDQDGTLIRERQAGEYAGLPVIVGEDAPDHAYELFQVLVSEPELARQVAAAVRVSGRRWNIRLENGVEVKLPEEKWVESWHRLGEMHRQKQLLERDIKTVDLRLKDRMFIQLTPQGLARRGLAGEQS